MHAVEIIEKKRDGFILSSEEISWFIDAYTKGTLPDYQVAAWLMAVYLRGMNREETVHLTLAMAQSGETLDLSDITDYAVDKHSSGGVGDKTTLVVLPLVASCGVPVAKMSGRGLGFSGGTLDKLESIAGFRVNLSGEEFRRLARQHGLVLAGQSVQLAPADGKLYALRDVTGTVSSLPLIASSIMSKKIAGGSHGMVLDVKTGSGAFMKNLDAARDLAQTMVDIGRDAGRDVIAVISDMNQPLGQAVGNALEVMEAIETLNGQGPQDFRDHCLDIAAYMLRLAGRGERWQDLDAVRNLLAQQLTNGEALAKFREMVEAQGGDVSMVDDPSRLPQAQFQETVNAQQAGFVAQVVAIDVANAACYLGAAREKKEDSIDPAVGVRVLVKVGDHVEVGQPLAIIYANHQDKVPMAREYLQHAIKFRDVPVDPLPLFYDVLYGDQVSG
jgi:pyrimidine-nucleoside phosphorylase